MNVGKYRAEKVKSHPKVAFRLFCQCGVTGLGSSKRSGSGITLGYRKIIAAQSKMSNEKLQQEFVNEPDYQGLLLTLGQPRLTPYKDFFRCASSRELAGAYLWGQAVAAAFQPTLGMYEVVLRNAIHLQASRLSSKGTSDSCAWYDSANNSALTIRGKTRAKVDKVLLDENGTRLVPQPAPDKVVASLSFGFWPNFLSGLTVREKTLLLTKIFHAHPHSKPKHWGRTENVQQLVGMLKDIQDLRNAVAHYEPIWKPHRLTGAEVHWSQSVQSLRKKHAEIIEVMAWCCPQSAAAVESSYATRILKSFCSTNAVCAFMADPLGAGRMQLFEPVAAHPLAAAA